MQFLIPFLPHLDEDNFFLISLLFLNCCDLCVYGCGSIKPPPLPLEARNLFELALLAYSYSSGPPFVPGKGHNKQECSSIGSLFSDRMAEGWQRTSLSGALFHSPGRIFLRLHEFFFTLPPPLHYESPSRNFSKRL